MNAQQACVTTDVARRGSCTRTINIGTGGILGRSALRLLGNRYHFLEIGFGEQISQG